jgi:hypothetical protein
VWSLTLGRRGREGRVWQHVGPGRGRVRHGQAHGPVAARAAGQLLPQAGTAVAEPHLYPGLRQLGALGQLLPRVDVRVLRAFERLLQLVQLLRRERRAAPTLFPLQGNTRLGLAVGTVARLACTCNSRVRLA